jgi:ornithine carbamoyltransferase
MRDFIPIATSYLDGIVIRASRHDDVVAASQLSRCPVINGLTDLSHPCQALADAMTIIELFGGLENLQIAFVGDANNVAHSLATLTIKLGAQFAMAAPSGYQFSDIDISQIAAGRTSQFRQSDEPASIVRGAHIVYTDVWTSMGQESERQQRLRDFTAFQVNSKLMQLARDDAKFLHCLPANRGQEVTADVIDGPQSAILLQAENRLHAQKGLLVWLLTVANLS